MSLAAGDLTERITLQRIQGDGDGEWLDLPSPEIPHRWASINWQGGGNASIRIRYDPVHGPASLRDTEPAMRVIYGAHVLDIIDVIESERRVEVQLLVKDVIVDSANLRTGGHRVIPVNE